MTPSQQSFCFRLLVIALLSGLAWIGSDLFLLRVEAALGDSDPQSAPAAQGSVVDEPSPLDLGALAKRNIFDSSARPEAAAGVPAGAEDASVSPSATTLNLVLRGTWVGQGARRAADSGAWAIIEDPAGHSQGVYKAGDALPGGDATVVEILPRAVKVRHAGQLELLAFPNVWESGEGATASGGMALGVGGAPGTGDVRQIAPGRYEVGRRLLDYKLSNLTETLTEARAIPVPGEGFRIRSIKKGSLFDQVGIQNGDLLRSVNGVQLTSIEQAMKAFKMLQKEPRLHLEIGRGSGTQTLDYEIR